MNNKILLNILDALEFVLSLIATILFIVIFKMEKEQFRYLFLLGGISVIVSYYYSIISISKKNKIRVIKNSNSKIGSKYLKKMSV